ncbi:MAG: ATP-binding cassette domain-containing protein [Nitrososphaerota archaeon]|nr:ATP-binding cassette domain-containing protein [Candidatus Calditenuaceae archaeon]MDW8073587.1 ATP-binding cassette domain-containing protein [Nitrososphaerota archaeon]
MTALLEARDIWFTYDSRNYTLRGVSMEIQAGKIYMVFGRSGAGKTTLLKILKGILKPLKGLVLFKGQPTTSSETAKMAYSSIGYIPQGFGIVSNISVIDNVLVGALSRVPLLHSLLGQFPREELERAEEVLEIMGLSPLKSQKVSQLSGGQRQRVAVARAMMQKPLVILADEFVSQLDPLTATEVLDVFRSLADQRKIAIVITSHDVHLASKYADQVLVLRNGEFRLKMNGGSFSESDLITAMKDETP